MSHGKLRYISFNYYYWMGPIQLRCVSSKTLATPLTYPELK